MFDSKKWLLAFGLFASIGMFVFLLHNRSIELDIGKRSQIARLEVINKKLEQFVATSNLLSNFIQQDINGHHFDKKTIEQNLHQYLRASPSEIIFGIGIWYEPFQYSKTIKYFGPYIHRPVSHQQNQDNILTHEWNTPEYNYHNQDWYRSGLQNPTSSSFVSPYFDNGLVYVTNSRAFFDKDKKIVGVISVDLVLPQLQQIIGVANQSQMETIYIVDRSGNLLAHPNKEQFFKFKKIQDGVNNQSLLNYKIEDLRSALNLQQQNWFQSEINQEQLGWKVIAVTSKDKLLDGFHDLQHFILTAFFLLWMIILVMWNILTYLSTQKSENEKQIELSRLQLIQSSKMASLGVMASGMAHEINNPLAIIVGKLNQVSRLLEKNQFHNEDVNHSLNQIATTTDRIRKIVDGLRTFARSGENDLPEPTSLDAIITETIALCAERFAHNNIHLDVGQIPQISILCRSTQISQVLLNLLSNSFDAISELQEKWVKIRFQYDQALKEVRIEVTDSGNGISPEIAKRLHEPFFTTKDVGKGTGLGLSISKGIIEEHHGKLIYDEDSAKTKFIIILPV